MASGKNSPETTISIKALIEIKQMGQGGLEPPTSRLSGVYSNQLSY